MNFVGDFVGVALRLSFVIVPNDEIPTINVTTHHEETQNSNLNDHSGGQQHNQGNSGEHHRNLHNEEGDMNAHMRRPRAQPGRSAKVRAQASLKDLAKNSKGSKTSRRSRIRTTLVRKNNVTPSRQPANDVGPSEFTPFSGRSHTLRETANRDSQNNEGFDMHSGSHNTGSNPNIEKSTGSEPSSTNLLLLELEFLSFYVVYIRRLGLPGPGDAISMGGLISAFRDFLHEHMPHLSGVLDLVGPEALQGALVANLRSILLNYKMDVNVAEGNLHFTADK
ncbi:unnamed protein product [Cuscuta campestris]|uniref:Uncharacterized protein n=1 Tax=Cuscuta campestris TaxID=132261 RepID=A0A484LV35_9ASTE|nr:unnamed protein product [Cuscuta campestris]